MKKNYPALPNRFPTIYPGPGGAAVPTPASPDGLEASRIAGAGARLPLGAAVAGPVPGLFETGAENPPDLAGTDPVVDPDNPTAPPPPHSRFTLVQTQPAPIAPPAAAITPAVSSIAAAGPIARDPSTLTGTETGVDVNAPGGVDLLAWGAKNGVPRPGAAPVSSIAAAGPQAPTLPAPMASPQDDLTRNATALALERIMTAGPTGGVGGPDAGSRGGGAGIDPTLAPLGNAGRLMTAAAGLEGNKLNFASNDIIQRMGPMAPLATDTPEVRKSKFAYFTKVMNDETARDPTLRGTGTGAEPTTADLAKSFNDLMLQGQGPRYQRLGTDAEGRPIEGTLDRNGNFSRIAPEKSAASALKKLIDERDAYAKAGRQDVADHYDSVIRSYGTKFDAFGNPISAQAADGEADPFASEGLPTPKNKAERDKLPAGTKYIGPDGKTYTTPGGKPAAGGAAAQAGAATVVPQGPAPTADAIAHLVANPALAAQFDAKYGAAASKRYIR